MKEIPLSRGLVALVDDEDFERLSVHRWCASVRRNLQYAVRHSKLSEGTPKRMILMHRAVVIPDGESALEVDHIDGNGLNNQRSNLRLCSHRQNLANQKAIVGTSQYRGVWFEARRWSLAKPWRAEIGERKKRRGLGYFATEEAAARAYDVAAVDFFGPFARLNFPEDIKRRGLGIGAVLAEVK